MDGQEAEDTVPVAAIDGVEIFQVRQSIGWEVQNEMRLSAAGAARLFAALLATTATQAALSVQQEEPPPPAELNNTEPISEKMATTMIFFWSRISLDTLVTSAAMLALLTILFLLILTRPNPGDITQHIEVEHIAAAETECHIKESITVLEKQPLTILVRNKATLDIRSLNSEIGELRGQIVRLEYDIL